MTAIAKSFRDMITPEDLAWLQETAKLDGSTVGGGVTACTVG